MCLQWQLLVIFVNIFGTFCSIKRSVLYSGPSAQVQNRIACAVAYADNAYLALRINDVTGACEGLTWDNWGSSRSYDVGYTYIEKKDTAEAFDPPTMILGTTNWIFPGTLGDGGRLDIYFTPTPESDSYSMRLMDITDTVFNVYAGPPERIMVSMGFNRGSSVSFKTWTPEQWWVNHHFESPFPFSEGVEAKISIVPDTTNFKMYFDDRLITSYPFPAVSHPNDAKQIIFGMGAATGFKINKIIFEGI